MDGEKGLGEEILSVREYHVNWSEGPNTSWWLYHRLSSRMTTTNSGKVSDVQYTNSWSSKNLHLLSHLQNPAPTQWYGIISFPLPDDEKRLQKKWWVNGI